MNALLAAKYFEVSHKTVLNYWNEKGLEPKGIKVSSLPPIFVDKIVSKYSELEEDVGAVAKLFKISYWTVVKSLREREIIL